MLGTALLYFVVAVVAEGGKVAESVCSTVLTCVYVVRNESVVAAA